MFIILSSGCAGFLLQSFRNCSNGDRKDVTDSIKVLERTTEQIVLKKEKCQPTKSFFSIEAITLKRINFKDDILLSITE